MSDTIYRSDAINIIEKNSYYIGGRGAKLKIAIAEIKALPSADIDLSEYSDKLWKNAYERGKADGAMIYGNEHNCIMTIFGECSYAETGCGDCAVVEKVRKALSADRPQGEWIDYIGYDLGIKGQWLRDDGKTVFVQCDQCDSILVRNLMTHMNFCPNCGCRMKGADDE